MFGGGLLLSALVAAGLTLAGVLPEPRPQAALSWPGGLLLLGFLAGNVALQYGASRLPPQVTALVMLSEILFAAVSAWALDGAALTPPLLAGGALIVAAGVLSARASAAA
jgi:drug/metabolite transporter (DMT)-like permease